MATSKHNLSALLKEVQEYERARVRIAQCGSSTVQSINCIVLNGITHAGVVSHVCREPHGHAGDHTCCGHKWKQ